MNILIIEDNKTIQNYLIEIIKNNYPIWETDICSTFQQGLDMATDNSYDAFIIDYELDVNNTDKNGIHLGVALSTMPKYKNAPIIFETSYTEHIFNVVNKLNCVYYLTKPYDTTQVLDMLKKLENTIPVKKTISVTDEYGISAYIDLEDIILVEANHHKLTITMPSTTFICKGHSLDTLAKLCDGVLLRCHKSFLVNKNYVSSIDKKTLCVQVKHPSCAITHFAKLGRAYLNFMV